MSFDALRIYKGDSTIWFWQWFWFRSFANQYNGVISNSNWAICRIELYSYITPKLQSAVTFVLNAWTLFIYFDLNRAVELWSLKWIFKLKVFIFWVFSLINWENLLSCRFFCDGGILLCILNRLCKTIIHWK